MRRVTAGDYARMSWHQRRKYDEAVRRQIAERARRNLDLDLDLEAIAAARAVELLAFMPADPDAARHGRIVDAELAADRVHQLAGECDESFRRRVLDAEISAHTAERRPLRHLYPTNRKAAS